MLQSDIRSTSGGARALEHEEGTKKLRRDSGVEQVQTPSGDAHRVRALASTALFSLVLWLCASGRWGSYVGAPQFSVYITEIVLVVIAVTSIAISPSSARLLVNDVVRVVRRSWTARLVVALLLWTGLRLILGGRLDATSLRDAAPYGYAALGLVAAAWRDIRRSDLMVIVALAWHDVWIALSLTWPSLTGRFLALGPVRLLEIRPDFDAAVCGLAAAVLLRLALVALDRRRWLPAALMVAVALVNLYLVLLLHSRASLLSTVVALAVVPWGTGLRWSLLPRRAVLVVALVAALMTPVAAVTVLRSDPFQRLVDTFSSGQTDAKGTTQARQEVWGMVTRYVTTSPEREAIGVGFGPDYLSTIGAAKIYEGTTFTGVRAPHDYWLNTWVRLGAVGVALSIALALLAALSAVRSLWGGAMALPDVIAAALVLTLPLPASLGVILESPFGAVPYFWALGRLVGSGIHRRDGQSRTRGRGLATEPVTEPAIPSRRGVE